MDRGMLTFTLAFLGLSPESTLILSFVGFFPGRPKAAGALPAVCLSRQAARLASSTVILPSLTILSMLFSFSSSESQSFH
jgi:hypothetical protein